MHCKAPYVGLGFFLNNVISSCCKYPSIDGSEYISKKNIKASFENGKLNKVCQECLIQENYERFSKNESDYQILHIRLGDICNSNCTICDARTEQLNINNDYNIDYLMNLLKENIHKIKDVTIQGGETFLYKENLLKLLNILKENKSLRVVIVTNGTIPDEEIMITMSQFVNITLLISIDGNEETNHIMRPNCQMYKIKQTIELCRKNNVPFTINHTISILNVFDLEKNVTYYFEELKVSHISFNYVTTPDVLNIKNLHYKDKSNIMKQLIQIKNKHYRIIDFINIYKLLLDNSYDEQKIIELNNYLKRKKVDKIYNVIENFIR